MKSRMPILLIPILAGTLPIIAIVLSYIVSASMQHVSWCVPLWDGCTTISAVGRVVPESMIFKGTMNVAAVFIFLYWYLCYWWLKTLIIKSRSSLLIMLLLGVCSAIFLVVYTTALGHIGDAYQVQRRIGVTLFFASGFFAQVIQLKAAWSFRSSQKIKGRQIAILIQAFIILVLVIFGIANFVSHYALSGPKWVDNVIEWNFALLSSLFYICSFFVWRSTDLRVSLDCTGDS